MRFGILGPLAVWTDAGEPVVVPGTKVRALLADLLINVGQPVSADRLVHDIWSDDPPGNAAGTLSAKASQLRRALDDAEPGARVLVVSPPPGYRLDVAPETVDAHRFSSLTAAARATDDPQRAVAALTEALALWRGSALADFRDDEFAGPTIARFEEQRLTAYEDLAHARLELGEHTAIAGELADLVAEHPLRERLRASHIRALYGAGRQHDALASYEQLRAALADELGLDPSAELVALQRDILAQAPSLTTSAPKVHVRRRISNLPSKATPLIGRADAVRQVLSALDGNRLLTLTGPGGVGKTRLALTVATEALSQFADGVWLVELAGFAKATVADLAGAVAATLEIRDTGESADAAAHLAATIAERSMLLVLDNCEHVLDAAAELAEQLLDTAPHLHVLSTSREPLGVPSERLWNVDVLELSSAVELFVARAESAAPGFELDDDTTEAISILCRRLDGIPLALELAATRVRALGVHEMVARLNDRFRLLSTGHRGRPPRQQTLIALIDWSWQLLTPAEQTVLSRLSVFADGCTLEAAESICASTEVDRADVADLLVRLVDRSLVVALHTGKSSRYRLLESVAAFCLDRLSDSGALRPTLERHAAYYVDFAERAAPELFGAGQVHWLRLLDAEVPNMRRVLDDAVRDRNGTAALRLANSLAWFWFLRGRLGEGRRYLDAAIRIDSDADPALRASASAWAAGFAFTQGDADDREGLCNSVLAQFSDPPARARAEWFLGFSGLDLGEFEASVELVDQALTTFVDIGDRWGIAAVHLVKAVSAHIVADVVALEESAKISEQIFDSLGDRWGQLQATAWLGGLAELRADFDEAIIAHTRGLAIAQELELWQNVSVSLSWLGWVAMQQGDFVAAQEYCAEGLRLAAEQGAVSARIMASMGLGLAARRAGDVARAEEILHGILDMAPGDSASEPQAFRPVILCELGFIHEQRGEVDAAFALHIEAYEAAISLAAPRDLAYALVGLAGASAFGGQFEPAARLLGAAEAVRTSVGMPPSPAEQDDIDRIRQMLICSFGEESLMAGTKVGHTLSSEEIRKLVSDESIRESLELVGPSRQTGQK
ncbi:BTAD domain-containing putative transcriptional regulator [Antrihabitans stalactiti]|uniref:AfsR/SARP family transcriptional regulator n=1 Tax=Antrihabitans stalactiti TaxID=2584121 RepID=A0A848KAB1_9NOCA|nr:BTAD domain-containing putative transcriptional regulator [Antrihabitans stalactiti]NMN95311.1 AfsR/SARP family transcriptional regulator [Antrihabitans stalactiti]